MEILKEKLNVISNKNIRRRIERELLQLLEFNIIDPFNVYISFDNNRQTNYNKNYYTISFYSMKDNNLYVFVNGISTLLSQQYVNYPLSNLISLNAFINSLSPAINTSLERES